MRELDKKSLLNFLIKMGMYIYPIEKQTVVSFLNGYEAGSHGECAFTIILSKILEDKYHIKKYATGWPDQVEKYAEMGEIDWIQGFCIIASEVLNESIIR